MKFPSKHVFVTLDRANTAELDDTALKGCENHQLMMIAKLQAHPTPTEKATYVRFNRQARGTAVIGDWCLQEFERQEKGEMPPEIGMGPTKVNSRRLLM
jgi:hypothetical protein